MTLPRRLVLAIKAFNEKKFEEIAPLLDEVMKMRHRSVRVYKLVFHLYAQAGASNKAEEVYEILKTKSKPDFKQMYLHGSKVLLTTLSSCLRLFHALSLLNFISSEIDVN